MNESSQNLNVLGKCPDECTEQAEPVEFSLIDAIGRLMRGRWLVTIVLALALGGGLAYGGLLIGKAIYESIAIVRISARDPGILYVDGDTSKLKLFNSFVKGETSYLASHAVMERAYQTLVVNGSKYTDEMSAQKLRASIQIKRNEALIVVRSKSADAEFAAQKVNAVVDAYIALHEESKTRLSNFRQTELATREAELLANLEGVNASMLEVGGEFGMASLIKTHIKKVTQIEELIARQAEVASTLAAMEANDGPGSADMADQEIIRATLLDRGLADLNFEKAKLDAELSTILLRYAPTSSQVMQMKDQIAIIDQAMANRRNQIQVLGQTGALTDGSQSSKEESTAEIKALLTKVTDQLAIARTAARNLNSKRVKLDFLNEERDEARRMLDETRQALDIIQIESRNSNPGFVEVMSRAISSSESSSDSRKILAAGGLLGGMVIALILVFGFAMTRSRVRFSDDLWRYIQEIPLLITISKSTNNNTIEFGRKINKARNNIQLFPTRSRNRNGQAQIISVCRFDIGDSQKITKALADSFATAKLRALIINADLIDQTRVSQALGWREMVLGGKAQVITLGDNYADVIEIGTNMDVRDASVSITAVRSALKQLSSDYDVIVIHVGDLSQSLSAELILATSDLAVGIVSAGDKSVKVMHKIQKLDSLPVNGGGIVFTNAGRKDPSISTA